MTPAPAKPRRFDVALSFPGEHRARLFFREAHYLWTSPQAGLAEARRLIVKHAYRRRMEELKEADTTVSHRGDP